MQHSLHHPKYNNIRVALSPVGFVLLPVYTIIEQEKPNTPFIARILEDGKAPYEFDPHPSAWWMFTQSDLVRATNKQVRGIRYVSQETFQVCVTLTGLASEEPNEPEGASVDHRKDIQQ